MSEYEEARPADNLQPPLPTLPALVSAAPLAQSAQPAALRSSTALSLQARADRWMVRAIPQVRYCVARLGYTGVAGLVSLVAALILAVVVLIPVHQSIQGLSGELSQAAQAGPVPAAQTLSPHQFAGTLPSRGQVPALLGTVLAQAADAGVVLEQGKYTFTPAAGNRMARYTFEFPVKAEYAKIRSFINKSLTAIPALGLEKLHIERKNVGDTTVMAEVGFVIYLRGA